MSPLSFACTRVQALARVLTGAAALALVPFIAAMAQDAARPAPSDAAPQGLVNAVGYLPIPEKAVLNVRPLDNSDANMRIMTIIEESLRARGFGVAADAPLTLSFDTRDEIGAWSETGRRSILELKAEGGREGGEYAHAKVNIFDSATGGLLNEGRSGTSIATPSAHRIDVTVDDRSNGKRLWQGWAVANLSHGDRADLDRLMIPKIIETLGRTVNRQPFNLQ